MINGIYSLPVLDFVGGSSEQFLFHVYCGDIDQQPYTLAGCTALFSIAHFTNKTGTPLISKEMSIQTGSSDGNILTVKLLPSDTVDLAGKYVYQIMIKDDKNNVDLQQGVLYIHSNINRTALRSQS